MPNEFANMSNTGELKDNYGAEESPLSAALKKKRKKLLDSKRSQEDLKDEQDQEKMESP